MENPPFRAHFSRELSEGQLQGSSSFFSARIETGKPGFRPQFGVSTQGTSFQKMRSVNFPWYDDISIIIMNMFLSSNLAHQYVWIPTIIAVFLAFHGTISSNRDRSLLGSAGV